MGTDIWAYIEYRENEKSPWCFLPIYVKDLHTGEIKEADFYNGRDYELFSQLARVRGSQEPFAPTRGIPDDISPEVREHYNEGKIELSDGSSVNDFHNASWYDILELKLFSIDKKSQFVDDWGNTVKPIKDFYEKVWGVLRLYWLYPNKPGMCRVVFWFDS